MPLTPEQALKLLVEHALGAAPHANNGMCPGAVDGSQMRDPECKVCQALNVLEDVALSPQFVLMPRVLPLGGLNFCLDLHTMSMVRGQ